MSRSPGAAIFGHASVRRGRLLIGLKISGSPAFEAMTRQGGSTQRLEVQVLRRPIELPL